MFLDVKKLIGMIVKLIKNTEKGIPYSKGIPFSIQFIFHKYYFFAFFSPTPPMVKALIYITLLIGSWSGLPLFCSYIAPYSQTGGI